MNARFSSELVNHRYRLREMATVSRKPCFTVIGFLLMIIMILQLLAWTESFSVSGGRHSFDGKRNSHTGYYSTSMATTTTTSNLMHRGGPSSVGPLLFGLSGGDWKKSGRDTPNRSLHELYCLSVSVPAARSTARWEPIVPTAPSLSRSSFRPAHSQSIYHAKNSLGFAAVTLVKPPPPLPFFPRKIRRKDSSFSSTSVLSENDSSIVAMRSKGKTLGYTTLAEPWSEAGLSPWDHHPLPSNPIERFSGRRHGALAIKRPGEGITAIPSFLIGLIDDIRPRAFWSGGRDAKGGRCRGIDGGLRQQLYAAIAQVEAWLSTGSREDVSKGLWRERDRKKDVTRRLEAIARRFDEMRRNVAVTEAELCRNDRRVARAEEEREKARMALSEQLRRLANGLEEENEKFIRKIGEAQAREGQKGAAMDEITHTYSSRVRALSDGLAATQDQLARLTSDRNRERRESEGIRKQLTTQVARLEAQLTRAGQSVQQERAEMESVLYRLSSALAGVDEELMQSADTTPSPEAKRELRQVRERFRLGQRSVKLLLEGQKRRYDTACHAMEGEAQRLRIRMIELDGLKANLAASVGKERDLKSSVWALGGKISALDKELRKAREALDRERRLRCKAEAALFSTEERRKQETLSLRHELEATRQSMATTRKVYESTVGQRQSWRRAVREEGRAKTVARERAKASESALRGEVTRSKCSAAEREREISELKAQVVHVSRSLLTSETEKRAQTRNLERDINRLTEETKRLKLQAENGKKTVARTVMGVLSRTFLNAPHGLLAKLGERLKARPRNSAVGAAPDPPSSPTDRHARVGFRDEAVPSAPDRASSKGSARAEKGLLRGLFGSETSAVDGIASGPRDKGVTGRRSPPLSARPPLKQERNRRREKPVVFDGSGKASTATGDSGSLRTGLDSRRKQNPENHRDGGAAKKKPADSPAQGTEVVTSPPKSNKQKATTRKRVDQNRTTFETKKSDPETTGNPAGKGGAVGSNKNDRIPGNNVQAASKRLSAPRPEPQSSHTLAALPTKIKLYSPSVPSEALLKASASAASGAVKSISRIMPGGDNRAAARNDGTAENDDGSGAEQNRQAAVDEGTGGSRKHSHCTRDQPGQTRWHDVDVLKERDPHHGRKVAANSARRGSEGGGNKRRSPWASSVSLPGGGYAEETEDDNATPAVTASTLSATTASYGQNVTGSGDTINAAPSLELQLHFIGVGA